MFEMKMSVVYKDGRKQLVKVRPQDAVAFEVKHDVALIEAFADESKVRLSHMYFIAWSAADASLPFEEWIKTVDEIEMAEAADAAPLDPAAPAGS